MPKPAFKDKQAEYRAYLHTPLWAQIRAAALSHYGSICNRCGEYGNDVHHKSYERVGGNELLEDLEVLCRQCHDAHHAIDRIAKPRRKRRRSRRSMHITGALNYLKPRQKRKLSDEFGVLYRSYAIERNETADRIRNDIMAMLGLDYIHGLKFVIQTPKATREYPAIQEHGKAMEPSDKRVLTGNGRRKNKRREKLNKHGAK